MKTKSRGQRAALHRFEFFPPARLGDNRWGSARAGLGHRSRMPASLRPDNAPRPATPSLTSYARADRND